MAVVDTALLLLCRSHQAHSVDNQMLASLLLYLSSMFSWYRKAQLDRFPCVAFGTHAEEQPSHLNCSYLQQQQQKKVFIKWSQFLKNFFFFFIYFILKIFTIIQDYWYLLKVVTNTSSINKAEVCTGTGELALKILGRRFLFPQLSAATSLVPRLTWLWER